MKRERLRVVGEGVAVDRTQQQHLDRTATPGLPQFVDAREIALALGIGVRTFRRLRSEGVFPGPDLTIGQLKRWSAETVQRWVEANVRTDKGGRP
jgi:predicted DNA-binding transcriptional regulator AlpA